MSLKIKSWRKTAKIVAGVVLGLLFLTFFVKVATFEDAYYREKEGSERAESPSSIENEATKEELVEEKPTEAEVYEYNVEPGYPRYLRISRLGIQNARIIQVSINDSGEMGTPNNIFDVGWYRLSSLPGNGGTVVIDGHNGGPNTYGVFKELPSLLVGDIIEIECGGDDRPVYRYKVVENKEVGLGETNHYMARYAFKSPESGKESLTLITCSGEWSDERKTYLSRQFVRAVLVE